MQDLMIFVVITLTLKYNFQGERNSTVSDKVTYKPIELFWTAKNKNNVCKIEFFLPFVFIHLFVIGTGSWWSTGEFCLAVLTGLGGQVVWVLVPPHHAPPAACVLPSSDRRLKPPCLRPPVRVLPALHQYHQGVEPEEDDDGDDDALKDDPDVDVVGARH